MMLHVPGVLSPDQVADLRTRIDAAAWEDGNATAGPQSALAKRNLQLPETSDAARTAGAEVRDALTRNPLFMSAALPPPPVRPFRARSAITSTPRFQRDQGVRRAPWPLFLCVPTTTAANGFGGRSGVHP